MQNQSAIAERIQTALAQYLKRDPGTIQPDMALRDDLGLDSMATIELLFRIEEAFDLQIPDEDLQKLSTVADVITYVEGRLAPPPPSSPAAAPARRSSAKKKD
ncbi:acyl carrier protein [Nitrospira sp. Kam-Ns4a]